MTSSVDNIANKKLQKELSATIRAVKVSKTLDLSHSEFVQKMERELDAQCITRHEYRQLVGLYNFMSKHPELNDKQVAQILETRPLVFWFLNECVCHIRDFLLELRKNGVDEMAIELATRNALRIYSDEMLDK